MTLHLARAAHRPLQRRVRARRTRGWSSCARSSTRSSFRNGSSSSRCRRICAASINTTLRANAIGSRDRLRPAGHAARRRGDRLRHQLFGAAAAARDRRRSGRRPTASHAPRRRKLDVTTRRAERRRQQRGGAAPPPRRDPMRPVYIGIGIAVVAIILVFVGFNWWQSRSWQQAYATPTPGPNATRSRFKSANGENLGVKFSKENTPTRQRADAARRSTASPAARKSTRRCTCTRIWRSSTTASRCRCPQFIGFAPNLSGGASTGFTRTTRSGIIHIEAPDIAPPQGGPYTLGMLFDIWGQPLTPEASPGSGR